MEIFHEYGVEFLLRYGHVIAGITWIGLLYYFNFVQTPAFAEFEAGPRNEAFAKLVPRAMWWFRWAAMATLAFGLALFMMGTGGDRAPFADMKDIETITILGGMLFATIMWANVWFVIWPAQKRAIANAKNVLGGGEADATLPPVMRRAATASRTNTFLSIPMLFLMVGAPHLFAETTPHWDKVAEGGNRIIWYAAVLAVAIVAEAIALQAAAVGSPQTWHLDKHKNTIIAGFVLTIVLYLVAELAFGVR
jgi:uncharacterized membrane protein